MLLPGSGVFLACILAPRRGACSPRPTIQPLAYTMLPHSLTLLLEGEGYILATLFGLLIPIHVVQSSLGGNPLTRFGRVLLLNLKANFLTALVLAVAAIYVGHRGDHPDERLSQSPDPSAWSSPDPN